MGRDRARSGHRWGQYLDRNLESGRVAGATSGNGRAERRVRQPFHWSDLATAPYSIVILSISTLALCQVGLPHLWQDFTPCHPEPRRRISCWPRSGPGWQQSRQTDRGNVPSRVSRAACPVLPTWLWVAPTREILHFVQDDNEAEASPKLRKRDRTKRSGRSTRVENGVSGWRP